MEQIAENIAENIAAASAHPTATEDSKQAALLPVSNEQWLQPFMEDKSNGLPVFIAALNKNPSADPVFTFRNCLREVMASSTNSSPLPDQLDFTESYDLLTKMKQDRKPQTEIDKQTSKVSWIFLQCMKALFLIGHYSLPAMHFCGSVRPDLMLENAAFHGFNERCAIDYSLDERTLLQRKELRCDS